MTDIPDELRASLEARTTEDLVSILRNRDVDEWRPEVFELVASILVGRGIAAASVSVMGPEGGDAVEHRPLVTVARYFSPAEAHVGRLALEAAGLEAWVWDEALGAVYGVGIGTRLQVRLADEEAAQAVLEGGDVGVVEVPPELVAPPCPKCASGDVSLSSDPIRDHDARGAGGRRRDWHFDCRACGHRWRDETA